MPPGWLMPVARSAVSYLPSSGLFRLRALSDLPRRLRRQPHEGDFLALRAIRRTGCVVVDVGANRGQSIASFRMVLNRPHIEAFEPNPGLAERLGRIGGDVVVHACGLGAEAGAFELFVPRYGNTRYDTRATLDESTAGSFLGERHFARFRSDRAQTVSEPVEIRRLDDFRLVPDIVKIDVEGTVPDVVRGAETTLRSSRPLILVEEDEDETASLLADLGYRPARFDPGVGVLRVGEAGSINTFYVQPDHDTRFGLILAEPA